MTDFIAQYCHRNDKLINKDLFERTYDRPLADYVVETCKNLQVIPGITLVDYWIVTDQTKIRSTVNKRNAKDPKIKNNRTLETLAKPKRTLYDMLYLKFRVRAKGQEAYVTRKVRVLKTIRGGHYLRKGKRTRVLNQVVDNSTFVKKDVLNFKTKLYAIKLYTTRAKIKFIDGDTMSSACFRLDLLSKITNPLIYFLANYGLAGTIERFNLEGVMSVVDAPLNEDDYLYVKIAKDVYIEVHEKALYTHEFVPAFVATLQDVLSSGDDITFKRAYDKTYWMERLSEIFAKKRYVDKALRVLISYNKIVDLGVKRQLKIKKSHKRDTFSIIRWMMVNYGELLKKDSHDMKNKRIRANETLVYSFDKHVSKNVYSLLNTTDPPFDKYLRMLNSINEFTLLKGTGGTGKTSPTSMLRDERYNDFDAIELSRYTLKGPTGINGGKQGTSIKYRDIYTSQIGRLDVNVCTSSDPGLTGYLCANCQLDPNGYFDVSPEGTEPDVYDTVIEKKLSKFMDPDYESNRHDYVEGRLNLDEDGFFVLKKKMTRERVYEIMNTGPVPKGLYLTSDGLHLIPKLNRDQKGFIVLTKRRGKLKEEDPIERDADGFIVLRRTVTKMSLLSSKSK